MMRRHAPPLLLLLCLWAAGPALAQPGQNDRQRDANSNQGRGNSGHPIMRSRQPQMDRGDRGERGDRRDRNDAGRRRDGERGAGPDQNFYRGDRLPQAYRNRGYVVDDWRGHHLTAPPRGYHWVQTGGDYVLVAIATGVILQLLLGN